MNKEFLNLIGISEDEAWRIGEKNTKKNFCVKSMAEAIGLPTSLEDDELGLYVISKEDSMDGSSCLLFPEILKKLCKKVGIQKAVLLPSSIHELILVEDNGQMPYSFFADMVHTVNSSPDGIVDELIQLDAVVYKYDVNTNTIDIAASA